MARQVDILVIDDEQVILDAVEKICGAEGYSIETAADGQNGLERIRAASSRIILCDIMMPQVDGFQILQEAQRLTPDVPVVMATGYTTVENAVRSLREGAIDFVPKPFTSDELLSAVRRALRYRDLKMAHSRDGASKDDPMLMVVPCPPLYYRLGLASWVALEGTGTAVVGLSHLFVRITDPIESVELLPADGEMVQGTACAQVKTHDGLVHPVLAPVSGRIVERQEILTLSPGVLEKDPYFEGWMYRIVPTDVEYELQQLIPCSSNSLF